MSFKDMPLDTTLQVGDIVTITGPGEHDVLVREVTVLDPWDGSAVVAAMFGSTEDMVVVLERDDRTLTRIQRHVPALPTVEGDYMLTLSNGYRSVVSLRDGVWLNGLSELDDVHWLTARVEEGSTLTRVIPADEVERPEVDMKAAVEEFSTVSSGNYDEDFEIVLRRVLAGEFDL